MSSEDKLIIDNGNPKHIAIIMDGNGRWAEKRFLPRVLGHRAGVKTVKKIVEYCAKEGIEALSLFAFSSENWRRPKKEVELLMELFMGTLQSQINKLDDNNIKLRIIGDKSAFSEKLQDKITEAERQTQDNTGLNLVIAANYGGHWDITQAFHKINKKIAAGELQAEEVTESVIGQYMTTSELPNPDLFIRTGGEQRISNFLLWQLAYTEFYFTETLWPDFDKDVFLKAVDSFKSRQRRFGRTSEQVVDSQKSK